MNSPTLKLLELSAEIEKRAHREICDLAKGKRFDMHSPIEKTDSDIILQRVCDIAESQIEIIRVLYNMADCLTTQGYPDTNHRVQWMKDQAKEALSRCDEIAARGLKGME